MKISTQHRGTQWRLVLESGSPERAARVGPWSGILAPARVGLSKDEVLVVSSAYSKSPEFPEPGRVYLVQRLEHQVEEEPR